MMAWAESTSAYSRLTRQTRIPDREVTPKRTKRRTKMLLHFHVRAKTCLLHATIPVKVLDGDPITHQSKTIIGRETYDLTPVRAATIHICGFCQPLFPTPPWERPGRVDFVGRVDGRV
jgi:hypothetical protein